MGSPSKERRERERRHKHRRDEDADDDEKHRKKSRKTLGRRKEKDPEKKHKKHRKERGSGGGKKEKKKAAAKPIFDADDDSEPKSKRKERKQECGEEEFADPTKRRPMRAGDIVHSGARTFKIQKLLGAGGFGDVYKVELTGSPGQFYAMKTELSHLHPSLNRLKMEVLVFEDINESKAMSNLKHFVRMIDKGMTSKYKFLVMTLTGSSLSEIRSDVLKADFTRSTAIRVTMQTLQCVHDIHALGYIHRDIKLSNFTIGFPPKTNVIYMLDFGISRKYLNTAGMRGKREKVLFMGTIRYASRSSGAVPIISDLEIYKTVPVQMREIAEYVDKLNFDDEPNYDKIAMILIQALKKIKCAYKDPYDWETSESGTPMRRVDEMPTVAPSTMTNYMMNLEKKTPKHSDPKSRSSDQKTDNDEEERVEMASEGANGKSPAKKALSPKRKPVDNLSKDTDQLLLPKVGAFISINPRKDVIVDYPKSYTGDEPSE